MYSGSGDLRPATGVSYLGANTFGANLVHSLTMLVFNIYICMYLYIYSLNQNHIYHIIVVTCTPCKQIW